MSRRQRRRNERRQQTDSEGLDRSRRFATGAGVTVGATLLMGGAAQAATLTVGSTADTAGALDCADPANTDCTLRQAITDANAAPGSTITFRSGLSGTIALTAALPGIYQPTTITGPGPGQITVSGQNSYRIFFATTGLGDDVSISGLTIAGGSSPGPGSGVYSKSADLTLRDTVVSGNDSGSGGGIAAYTGGSLTIDNSTISGNTAAAGRFGGGVYTESGSGIPGTIRNSTISGNEGGYGGGIYFDYSSPATLDNSTVYGNTSHNSGGGVYDFGPYGGAPGLTVTASTITHNTAQRGGGLACYGSYSSNNGGHDLTEPVVRNTIISQNNADSADAGPDLSCDFGVPGNGGTVDTGFSLIGAVDPGTTLNQTGPNILGQDPQLGPLASNGGSTQTQKPAVASPVVDQGAAFGLGSDQRGGGRPLEIPSIPNAAGGDGSDIGAVELQASELPSNAFTVKVKGKKLIVSVAAAGGVSVGDAKAPLAAAAKKKKRKLLLNTSSGSGSPPKISVTLRLTKLAKRILRQKGKVTAKARITFTPNRGLARTQTTKLKIRGKRKK